MCLKTNKTNMTQQEKKEILAQIDEKNINN